MDRKALISTDDCAKSEVYTVEEVKTLLGISRSTVYGILRAKLFPHTVSDGQYEIPKSDFDKWFDALQQDIEACHAQK